MLDSSFPGLTNYSEPLRFLQLSQEEKDCIKRIAPILLPRLPEIIDQFYATLNSFGLPQSFLTSPAMVKRLKQAQSEYFRNLLEGIFDDSYIAKRRLIGKAHERIGLEPRWYIGGYAVFSQIIFPFLRQYFADEPVVLEQTQLALLKAFFLDIQIAMETYIEQFAAQLIDARRSLEQKLWMEDRLLSCILTKATDAIVGLDEHSRIVTWSQGAQRIFGYKTAEILDKSPADLIRHPLQFLQLVKEAAETGTATLYASEWQDKERIRITCDATLTFLRDRNGIHVGSTLLLRDITEIRELASKVKNMEQLHAMTRITAGVAHEIRTPLSIMALTADLMQDRVLEALDYTEQKHRNEAKQDIRDMISDLQTEVDRLNEIVSHYLVLSRIKKPTKVRTQLKSFLEELMGKISKPIRGKQIEYRMEIPDDLIFVNVDPDHFRRVLVNLFDNSHYAIQSEGEIHIRIETENNIVRIQVRDTGIGIPHENEQDLFSAFVTTKPGGTGLGLYLVREIIEAHSGSVFIESPDNHGTIVTIVLPLASEEDESHGSIR
jgi:PAS domain S-box-containing protein